MMAAQLGLLLLALATTCSGLNPLMLSEASCRNACGTMDPSRSCQCNQACVNYNDCCDDYLDICEKLSEASCRDECGTMDPSRSCQCNWACVNYNDCCDDYLDICENGNGATNTEIAMIAEKIWALDVNRLPDNHLSLNRDGGRFFKYVNEEYFERVTFQRLIALLDNYIAHTGIAEPDCPVCRKEEEAFLDAVMETSIMQRTWEFLADRGLASTTESGFRAELKQYWFQMYSRSSGPLDSSGFEHVFLGEIKKNKVSGFHNWVQFYKQEQKDLVTNYKYIADCYPNQDTFSMSWLGYSKPITGAFVGTSPEFDFAMYTICFVTRPGKLCRFTLDGHDASVQSYTMSNVTPMTIGTVYDVCE